MVGANCSAEYPGGAESGKPGARRIALLVEYEGANYAGFQLQAEDPTIQGELERALKQFLGCETRIRGASRTDSGAHALGQVVDFETDSRHTEQTFVGALNYYLPGDIKVVEAAQVPGSFNSRRDARSRIYRYQILNRPAPSPLLRRYCHWVREPLQIERMSQAALDLVGVHDFRPLAPGHPADRISVREVYRWEVTRGKEQPGIIVVTCEANGFMRHQIRRTNAVLVEIGKGRWPVDAIRGILGEAEDKTTDIGIDRIPSLPARGLCLMKVKYSDQLWKVKQDHETN